MYDRARKFLKGVIKMAKIKQDVLYFEVKNMRVEKRAAGEGEEDKKTIKGEAIVFNQKSLDLGGFREIILPGAADQSLLERNQKAYWNHNPDFVLGSVRAGTMSLTKTETGISFEISPSDSPIIDGFVESIDRGDVDQMSFTFRCLKDEWRIDHESDEVIREVITMDFWEISPVARAAYPQTSVSMRDRFGEDGVKLAEMINSKENLTEDQKRSKIELMKLIESKISNPGGLPVQDTHDKEMQDLKFDIGVL